MPSSFRRQAERVGMFLVATVAISAVVADLFGWFDRVLPSSALPKITLLVLSTITIFLLLELDRFHVIDVIKSRLDEIEAEKHRNYAGVVQVHPLLDYAKFVTRVNAAKQVTVLNTWIPNLELLQDALEGVAKRGGEVRILLVEPGSQVAKLRHQALLDLRHQALLDGGVDSVRYDVRAEVDHCIQILSLIHKRLKERRKPCLRVRMFNSLPSISVYQADDRYLVSVFLHGQLAINSPQFDIRGSNTELGKQVQREIDTLWQIGRDVNLGEVIR